MITIIENYMTAQEHRTIFAGRFDNTAPIAIDKFRINVVDEYDQTTALLAPPIYGSLNPLILHNHQGVAFDNTDKRMVVKLNGAFKIENLFKCSNYDYDAFLDFATTVGELIGGLSVACGGFITSP
jgi:hypothetical protein